MLRASMVVLVATVPLAAQSGDLASVLARVTRYVEEYSTRAHSVLAQETILFQPLARDLTPSGFPRRLVYDLRFEWNPSPAPGEPQATFVRHLVSASGPEIVPNEQDCLAPPAISPQVLTFLMTAERGNFIFEPRGAGTADGRAALIVDVRPRSPTPVTTNWMGQCGRVDLSGRKRGRVWIDAATGAVLRVDERLAGPVDLPGPPDRPGRPDRFTFERDDISIAYAAVTFTDPAETLMLPERIDRISVVRNAALSSLRTTHTFSNYRRFLTESRLVR